MENKKGISQTWFVLGTAIVVVILVVLTLVWFNKGGGELFDNLNTQIAGLADCDADGVVDVKDKCPCDPIVGEENVNAKGCSKGVDATECSDEQRKKVCPKTE